MRAILRLYKSPDLYQMFIQKVLGFIDDFLTLSFLLYSLAFYWKKVLSLLSYLSIYISMDTYGFLFYSIGCNPLL